MKRLQLVIVLSAAILFSSAFGRSLKMPGLVKDEVLARKMSASVSAFLKTLGPDQKKEAVIDFENPVRFDWHYIPRERKGLSLKKMNQEQRAAAMAMIKVMLSAEGYQKTEQIIDLENVLRVMEKRPSNDTYRDPENFSFSIFGDPAKDPWGWRVEGHHLSLNFTSVHGEIAFTPGFFGSNPGTVLIDVPQKGRRILHREQDLAFELLNSLTPVQLVKVSLNSIAPNEIFTTNTRKASLEKTEGLAMKDMSKEQRAIFEKLIKEYLNRYHVTLKNQQWAQLEKAGLENIYFAWMGDSKPVIGNGHGHYYRIHGPSLLIEFDNTQNGGNHIHSVVRDLNNDFGEDMLGEHYEKAHSLK